ncbi:MAG: hypothetical protein M1823_003020 [Watsoniomyces obsoletus]|nr:MAG: hypothetical protein M1823_003020 [Watsoniomyces obsoletus]
MASVEDDEEGEQRGDGGGNAGAGSRKVQNEAYFAKLAAQNASRKESVPPNQGGKYTGFGSSTDNHNNGSGVGGTGTSNGTNNNGDNKSMPGIDDFQKDPVAALTKGFGWFSTAVGKSAKQMNEGWIQPTAQKIAEAEITNQAKQTAAQLGQNLQSGTKTAAESFNRFVEGAGGAGGGDSSHASSSPFANPGNRARQGGGGGGGGGLGSLDRDKQDFWDSFGQAGDGGDGGSAGGGGSGTKSTAIGTAAMRKTN